jgi:hypothetical protein
MTDAVRPPAPVPPGGTGRSTPSAGMWPWAWRRTREPHVQRLLAQIHLAMRAIAVPAAEPEPRT